ncbi:hypothetical protein K439DRAFT_1629316 [Ramaria rubella]|nr:hypothetical protein K439DRAFT_1629316 [Ramaria rubella]
MLPLTTLKPVSALPLTPGNNVALAPHNDPYPVHYSYVPAQTPTLLHTNPAVSGIFEGSDPFRE